MGSGAILLVEDNPLTRGVLVEMLKSGGYEVWEAPDGRTALSLAAQRAPALVLQDLALPDMEGVDLLQRLRKELGTKVPILALSGLPGEIQRAQGESGVRPGEGFTDVLAKPVGVQALLLAVQAYATAGAPAAEAPAGGPRRVLVVEGGDALAALGFHIEQGGFAPTLAEDPAEALAEARRAPPAAVVVGSTLAAGDGFRLCHAIRTDPALAATAVVIVSREFSEDGDLDLARRVGASALVSPDERPGGIARALRDALAAPARPAEAAFPEEALRARTLAALRRESVRRVELERKSGIQAAALELLGAMADSLSRSKEGARAPDEILARCLAAAGTSQGAAFLLEPDGGFTLSAQVGFGEADSEDLRRFFGREDLLRAAAEARAPIVVPSDRVSEEEARPLLERLRARSLLVTPVVLGPDGLGVLVMISSKFDLTAWRDLSRAVAFEVTQAVSLSRAAGALASAESRYRALFEVSAHGIFRSNRRGIVVEANPSLATMLGAMTPDDLAGTDPGRWCLDDEGRGRVEAALRGAARFSGLVASFARADGAEAAVRLSGRPLRGPDGEQDGFEVIVEDVGGLRGLEDRIRAAERIGAMQRLAGGIVHDLNNLLTAIAGRAELLHRSLEGEADLHGHAVEIQRAVDRAGGIARSLQAFAQRRYSPVEIEADRVLDAAVPMLKQVAEVGVEVVVRRGAGAARILADPADLEQVLVALAARARDAMSGKGRILLESTTVVLGGEGTRENPGMVPGPYVSLAVSDSAPVLDDEARDRIFDPVTRAGGLGLSSVRDLVRRNGGAILLLPGREMGNTFRVYLPRRAAEAAEGRATGAPVAAAPEPAVPATGRHEAHGEVVLLAEDEDAVRSLIAETLRLEGYSVVEAKDGEEAERLAAEVEGAIDLLVTDVMMPRMGGIPLAARLRKARPGTPVLFVTGYFERPAEGGDELPSEDSILRKPFTPSVLAARVREVLAAAERGRR